MFKNEQDCLGINLSEHSLKIVHTKISATESKIVDVIKKDLREVAEEDVPKTIQACFSEFNVKRPVTLCALSADVVTTKNIEIPSLDSEEIKSIIDLQAGRHTPYSREEIVVGYITIGIFQRNYTKVLLIIVSHSVIKKLVQTLEDGGLKVDRIVFAPEAIAKFYGNLLHVKEDDIPIGVIDIANDSTNFVFEFNNTAATCRSIPIGLGHLIKEGDTAREKLLTELVNSLEAYQNEDINKPPENYILTSDDAKIKELQPDLQERLKANIKIMPYLDHIQAPQPIMLKLVSEYNDDSFLSVVSIAAALNTLQVDLTPDEIKTQRAIEEKGREVVKAGVFAIILFILVVATFISKIYFKGQYLSRLNEEFIEKRTEVVALDRVAQKTRIVKDYINSRMVPLEVMNELYHLVPEEIYLESIVIDEEGVIDIQGVSESMSRVFNFVTALEESKLFKGVKTKSTSQKKDRGKDAAAFQIAFLLESASDDAMEEKEPSPEAQAEAPAE